MREYMQGMDTRFRLANNWSVFYKYDESDGD